jgi:diaminopimelate epimerase
MHFFKYCGLGNDFLIFENTSFDASTVQKLCNRHFGIGADGILFVKTEPPFSFTIYNSDGSRANFCGNGLRCVARFLFDHCNVSSSFYILSDWGIHTCQIIEKQVLCCVPKPKIVQKEPFLVDAGVLHLVLFEKPNLKKALSYRKAYDANVTFCFKKMEKTYAYTYEKGLEAFSLACGSGILACFFALGAQEKIFWTRSQRPIHCFQKEGQFWMQAEADQVFDGTICTPLLV